MTAPARPEALGVECPHCGSPVGERCCTEWYYLRPRFPTRKPHAARVRRAASPLPGGKEPK